MLHVLATRLTGMQVCACGLGRFNNSNFECEACPSGKYQDQPVSTTICVSCVAGKKYVDAQTECSDCSAGQFALVGNTETACLFELENTRLCTQ